MIAFGLLLSLVFGAVVCGGLGSIAKQKNVQVVGIIKIKLIVPLPRCAVHVHLFPLFEVFPSIKPI